MVIDPAKDEVYETELIFSLMIGLARASSSGSACRFRKMKAEMILCRHRYIMGIDVAGRDEVSLSEIGHDNLGLTRRLRNSKCDDESFTALRGIVRPSDISEHQSLILKGL